MENCKRGIVVNFYDAINVSRLSRFSTRLDVVAPCDVTLASSAPREERETRAREGK